MASYSEALSKHATLAASTVDTVTLTGTFDGQGAAIVTNVTGTAAIYVTGDGSTPTVAGDDTIVIPAVAGAFVRLDFADEGSRAVKLISAGTPGYSVEGLPIAGGIRDRGGSAGGTISLSPATSGGLSVYRNIDLGATGQVVKASAGQLYNLFAYNLHSAVQFVKVYNKATAATEADTPIATIPVPAGSGVVIPTDNGEAYATGISVRGTSGLADNDTGATTASTLILKLDYK